MLAARTISVSTDFRVVDFTQQRQRIVGKRTRGQSPVLGIVRAKVRVAEIAENDLMTPNLEDMVFVLGTSQLTEFVGGMAAVEARCDFDQLQRTSTERARRCHGCRRNLNQGRRRSLRDGLHDGLGGFMAKG